MDNKELNIALDALSVIKDCLGDLYCETNEYNMHQLPHKDICEFAGQIHVAYQTAWDTLKVLK